MNLTTRTISLNSDNKIHKILFNTFLILSGSLIIALSSKISIFLPFSPVPVTAQTLAIFFIGFFYKKEIAFITVLTYIVEGLTGFSIFALPSTGLSYLLSPTFGYILGFLFSVYMLGYLKEKLFYSKNNIKITNTRYTFLLNQIKILFSLILANLIIYISGILWLSNFIGIKKAIYAGLFPFIIGDILKILFFTLSIISLNIFTKKNNNR